LKQLNYLPFCIHTARPEPGRRLARARKIAQYFEVGGRLRHNFGKATRCGPFEARPRR
jgi:hypothetical protein